mgnify:CR=1 FL=1
MWNPDNITPQQYAEQIISEITRDSAGDADFARCKSWEDLHDICDANDYYESADMALNMAMPSSDDAEDAFEAYMTLLNDASDIVQKWLAEREVTLRPAKRVTITW